VLAIGLLAGCSSSDGDDTSPVSDSLAGNCASDNPYAMAAPAAAGQARDRRGERAWVGAYLGEAYLWYDEIPALDPADPSYDQGPYFGSMQNWFSALRTPALTASGRRKDRYSFIYPSEEYDRLAEAGIVFGYGHEWKIGSNVPPRAIRVAYVDAGTPSELAGIARGDTLEAVTIDGVTVSADATDAAGIALLDRALFPARGSPPNGLRFRTAGGALREVTLAGADVPTRSVLVTDVRELGPARVGYLLVNDFVAPAEGQLVAALQQFRDAGVSELVLDLRYNGGGYVYIASQLAYMIAGAARGDGQLFERLRYNDKRMATLSRRQTDFPFQPLATGQPGSGTAPGEALPVLELDRVVVLASAATCSASESVINGLRGIDMPVVLIGATTCGKPYGFAARDNCGVSYFPIEFQGVNARGFGDYDDGFGADCAAGDDLGRSLGDPAEEMLAAALQFIAHGTCASAGIGAMKAGRSAEGKLLRHAVRESRYLQPPRH
jgi:C-terminal processing protease CtpA/Prc